MNSFNNDMAWEREKSLSINMPGLMKDIYLWVAIALPSPASPLTP